MLVKSKLARALAFSAAIMSVTPGVRAFAESKVEQRTVRSLDVTLVSGELQGKLLTANGEPVKGAPVSVSRNNKIVARVVTADDGSYEVSGLTPGVHTVGLSDGQIPVRLWSENAAPPTSQRNLMLSQTAVRGQYSYVQDGFLYVVVAGVIVSVVAIAIVESNDDDDDSPSSP